jgi:hypothetical protein
MKSRRMRWAGHVACMGKRKGVYRVLVEKPDGQRHLGRPRHSWEDNIKLDIQEVGLGGGAIDWIDLAQDRDRKGVLANAEINLAHKFVFMCTQGKNMCVCHLQLWPCKYNKIFIRTLWLIVGHMLVYHVLLKMTHKITS